MSPPCGANCQCHWFILSSISATSVIFKRKCNQMVTGVDMVEMTGQWPAYCLRVSDTDRDEEWLPVEHVWNESRPVLGQCIMEWVRDTVRVTVQLGQHRPFWHLRQRLQLHLQNPQKLSRSPVETWNAPCWLTLADETWQYPRYPSSQRIRSSAVQTALKATHRVRVTLTLTHYVSENS